MSDKAREEFEYWASDDGYNPAAVERSGHGYKLAQIQTYWQAWLAAKEKYEPRNCEWLYDEDTDSYDTQCGGKFQTIADSIEDNGIDFCCYCGGEISDAPSTQGEE